MQDNDWMIPRQFHGVSVPAPEEQSEAHVRIDPESLHRRRLRKERLSPQPTTATAEKPWLAIDRSIRSIPAFPNPLWTLGDTARWVIERTSEAVNGLSIDQEKLFEVLPEIHRALSDGEVSVFAITKTDPVPRELPAETWSVYELAVEDKNGLIRIFPYNSSTSAHEQGLLNLRAKREDVLQRWPAASTTPRPVRPTTIGAENQCRRWLAEMMTTAPTQPKPKAAVRVEAFAKFPGLSKRGFDRAWDEAIRRTDAQKWRTPGPRF